MIGLFIFTIVLMVFLAFLQNENKNLRKMLVEGYELSHIILVYNADSKDVHINLTVQNGENNINVNTVGRFANRTDNDAWMHLKTDFIIENPPKKLNKINKITKEKK